MDRTKYKRCACVMCGKYFYASRKSKYCSGTCRHRAYDRRRGSVAVEEYIRSIQEQSKWRFVCEMCGRVAHRNPGGTARDKGYQNRFCSMGCRKLFSMHESARRKALKDLVRKETAALTRISRYQERPKTYLSSCSHCGTSILVRMGPGTPRRCCDGCIASRKRAERQAAKARRRSIERSSVAEKIDPIEVFRRDGWKCHICGKDTPMSLRGSFEEMAPELDHIVPISKGGAHTWSNVACACRRCNGIKSNRPLGQIRLMFAA